MLESSFCCSTTVKRELKIHRTGNPAYEKDHYSFTELRSTIICNVYNAFSYLFDNESQNNTLNEDKFKKKVLQVFSTNDLLNEQLPYVILQCLKVTANSYQSVKNTPKP